MKRATLVLVSAVLGCSTTHPSSSSLQTTQSDRSFTTVVTQVALHYLSKDNSWKILQIDPGHMDLMFFDDHPRETFALGLQTTLPTWSLLPTRSSASSKHRY